VIEDEKLTAREKRKLRREFSQLDRDSVRYNLQIGGRRQRAVAINFSINPKGAVPQSTTTIG
jgi:hypothetical protein